MFDPASFWSAKLAGHGSWEPPFTAQNGLEGGRGLERSFFWLGILSYDESIVPGCYCHAMINYQF